MFIYSFPLLVGTSRHSAKSYLAVLPYTEIAINGPRSTHIPEWPINTELCDQRIQEDGSSKGSPTHKNGCTDFEISAF